MTRTKVRWALLAMIAAVPLAACDATDTADGRVSILLTDAPGDFVEAVVTINQIYLQGSPTTDEPGERVILMDEPVTTDLLTLANSTAELVGEAVVPAGTYGQLRFVLDGGYIVVEEEEGTSVYATDGYELPAGVTADGTLNCPSCAQTGIKVIMEGGLDVGADAQIVLVDFDVSETFGKQSGNSGRWTMHPTLKASLIELTGGITANVALATGVTLPEVNGTQVTLADFQAELKGADADETSNGELVAFADSDGDGTFTAEFTFVVPGDYTVSLVAPDSVTFESDPASPAPVAAPSNGTATQDFSITSAARIQ